MINTLERISREVANEYTGYGDSVNVFSEIELAEGNSKGTWIQVLRYGEWDHPVYGKVKVDSTTFNRLVQHFNEGVRGIDIAVDTEHKEDKGASGWIKKLDPRPTGLFAFVEWTKKGWSLIKDKVYRYISAEFSPSYEDPETKQSFKDVLVAVTLTNRPFIKRMAPVLLSEPGLKDQLLADYMFVSPMDTDEYESDESESDNYRFGCKCDSEKDEEDSEEGEDEGTPERGSRDPVRTLKMKHKNKKGGKKVRQFDDIGEYESGLDIDTEEFEEVMGESLFEDDYDEDTQEYDEDDDEYYDEDTQEYDEDEDELDGQYYDVPENAYAFSEGRQMIDHEARNAVIALSEQVQIEQEKNLRLQETLKLTAVEEEVGTWVENNGVGKIFPAQAELAVRLLMELPNREANMLRAFVESLPNSVEYGERGINTIETDQGGYSLQERAREIYDHYQNTNTPIKMGEAVKMAYKEINQ